MCAHDVRPPALPHPPFAQYDACRDADKQLTAGSRRKIISTYTQYQSHELCHFIATRIAAHKSSGSTSSARTEYCR